MREKKELQVKILTALEIAMEPFRLEAEHLVLDDGTLDTLDELEAVLRDKLREIEAREG